MKALPLAAVQLRGDLAFRAMKNHVRLSEPEYRPEALAIADTRDWPGDQRGRALLGLALQAQLTGWESPYYQAVLEDTLRCVEASGYMGAPMADGVADEQQLSGHNWLLRALLEVYTVTESPRVRAAADQLVRALYLPCAPLYRTYPHDAALRYLDGKPSGVLIDEAVDGWKLSTDIGCAFMSLDGLTQYYQLFRDEAVKALLDEMIAAFCRLDPVGSSLQTHATLTAARSLMRHYETTGDAALLDRAAEIWRLYVESGMTENYANFNWFRRPLWTEPCAIVDSYMLSMALFRATGRQGYLEAANRVLYSALLAAQRPNGGFGCDLCVQGEVTALSVRAGTYEASWCCTMRGAEGLAQAAQNALLEADGSVLAANYLSGTFAAGGLRLRVQTDYPAGGEVAIDVLEAAAPTSLGLYIPETVELAAVRLFRDGEAVEPDADGRILRLRIEGPAELRLFLPLQVRELPARLSRGATYWRGPELLGAELVPESVPADLEWAGERAYVYKGLRLFPAASGVLRTREMLERRALKVVFAPDEHE